LEASTIPFREAAAYAPLNYAFSNYDATDFDNTTDTQKLQMLIALLLLLE
jgi:hypothetical protein